MFTFPRAAYNMKSLSHIQGVPNYRSDSFGHFLRVSVDHIFDNKFPGVYHLVCEIMTFCREKERERKKERKRERRK